MLSKYSLNFLFYLVFLIDLIMVHYYSMSLLMIFLRFYDGSINILLFADDAKMIYKIISLNYQILLQSKLNKLVLCCENLTIFPLILINANY